MDVDSLYEFVSRYSIRGACTCGRCVDAPEHPEAEQPAGHVADLTFFKVSLTGDPDPDEFKALTKELTPDDGVELNYLALGGVLGDQGFALQVMGVGELLGAWKLLSPDTMMPFLDEETKQKMAGAGMVSITVTGPESELNQEDNQHGT